MFDTKEMLTAAIRISDAQLIEEAKQEIQLLRRKLDVAIIALECIADRPDPTKDEMLLVKFAQEALARYKAALSGEGK